MNHSICLDIGVSCLILKIRLFTSYLFMFGSLAATSIGQQIQSGECVAAHQEGSQLWSRLLPSSPPSCRGQGSPLNELHGGDERCAKIIACTHKHTLWPGFMLRHWSVWADAMLCHVLPWDKFILHSIYTGLSLRPAYSTQGDPQAALEHTVTAMFTKQLLDHSCLLPCTPISVKKENSIYFVNTPWQRLHIRSEMLANKETMPHSNVLKIINSFCMKAPSELTFMSAQFNIVFYML